MLRMALVRPGATNFDEQGRIKGTLDIPLSERGAAQADVAASELRGLGLEVVYCSPCQPATETAERIAEQADAKVKRLEKLHNVDQGLWQGKRIEEIRQGQPRAYHRWRDDPDAVCPPGGETVADARHRVKKALDKICKKHKKGSIALVTPEPLASLIRNHLLNDNAVEDLWEAECERGQWELFELNGEVAISCASTARSDR